MTFMTALAANQCFDPHMCQPSRKRDTFNIKLIDKAHKCAHIVLLKENVITYNLVVTVYGHRI